MEFITQFIGQFVEGLLSIVLGFISGIAQMFNLPAYKEILDIYSSNFGVAHWAMTASVIIALVIALASLFLLAWMLIKKYIRIRTSLVSQEELLREVGKLNQEVVKISREKERILAMKVSQLGLKPDESSELSDEDNEGNTVSGGESRFYKLQTVDVAMADFVQPEYDNEITLSEICERFRNFAASRMGLYYEIKIIRLFVAAFASTRLVILQGISGTGKTSLPYSFGKFLENDANIASVQPSWRDRSELFGYFNEFTKRFNETETLKRMYEATYSDKLYLTILDEMNIARVEYYFAEMLSILEMPSREEWVVDLVPSGWDSDPIHLANGRFRLPENMWYVGTANNDDSTFAISDKVYDRALPINIDSKGVYFDAPLTDPLCLSYKHLEAMFATAKEQFMVSQEMLDKMERLDDYVIEHFRLAFGNRIVKQLREFVPVYVACGATEIDGIDYVLANKILRKFESLNLAFIRDEIEGLVSYLSKEFGEENMGESKAYLARLQKLF